MAIRTSARGRGSQYLYWRHVYLEIQGHYSNDFYRSPLPVGAPVVLKQLTHTTVHKHCGTAAASDNRKVSDKTRSWCDGRFIPSRPETNDTQNCVIEIRLLTHSHKVWIPSDRYNFFQVNESRCPPARKLISCWKTHFHILAQSRDITTGILVVFLSTSDQLSHQYYKLVHDCFLAHSFQIVTDLTSNCSTVLSY